MGKTIKIKGSTLNFGSSDLIKIVTRKSARRVPKGVIHVQDQPYSAERIGSFPFSADALQILESL